MKYGPFLRGFLPGVAIGVFSSVLLFSLWHDPVFTVRDDRQTLVPVRRRISGSVVGDQPRHEERRDVEDANTNIVPAICNATYLHNGPIDGSYLLLVLIHSSADAAELRNMVRVTWLKEHKDQHRYAARFVIGTRDSDSAMLGKLACENKEYGDMLFLKNSGDQGEWPNSEKLLQSFMWAMQNVDFSYIFKCNDATFAVLDSILKPLQSRPSALDFLWGYFAGGIQATKEGKFAEKNWFLCSHYLPFPQGGGYIISHNLIEMLSIMEYDLEHYDHGDIALGVWLSPFEDIQKRHDVRFNTGFYSRGCNNAYIVTHRETKDTMFQKFSMFQKTGFICEEEFQSRLSYVYNWTAPASRCCIRKPGIP